MARWAVVKGRLEEGVAEALEGEVDLAVVVAKKEGVV